MIRRRFPAQQVAKSHPRTLGRCHVRGDQTNWVSGTMVAPTLKSGLAGIGWRGSVSAIGMNVALTGTPPERENQNRVSN